MPPYPDAAARPVPRIQPPVGGPTPGRHHLGLRRSRSGKRSVGHSAVL